ncbi:hypothetical protein [Stieleria magnilauensis]|uniref:hypothetical protein n=1 Tax=Stieleria magnilauensis TaxID=2527963 RepID=UPI003AF50DDF
MDFQITGLATVHVTGLWRFFFDGHLCSSVLRSTMGDVRRSDGGCEGQSRTRWSTSYAECPNDENPFPFVEAADENATGVMGQQPEWCLFLHATVASCRLSRPSEFAAITSARRVSEGPVDDCRLLAGSRPDWEHDLRH